MTKTKITANVFTALLLAVTVSTTSAQVAPNATDQKLPKTQETSVWAPDDIKIDGKLTEWNGRLQAYNPSEYLYYTIANTDKYLYLVARMTTENGNYKILSGGLILTIGQSPNSANKVSVRFPALLAMSGPLGTKFPTDDLRAAPGRYRSLSKDSVANKDKINSLLAQSNKDITSVFKNIQVTGVETIKDPLISIYNQEGIRVAASLNDQMEYLYELAIPLKYLGDELIKGEKFFYKITIDSDEIPVKGKPGRPRWSGPNADPIMVYRTNPTYFSGEYTLAKSK